MGGYGRAETAAKYLKQLHVVNPMVVTAQGNAGKMALRIHAVGGREGKKPVGCTEHHQIAARVKVGHKCVNLHPHEHQHKEEAAKKVTEKKTKAAEKKVKAAEKKTKSIRG